VIDGDAVVHELELGAPAADVYAMFTDPALLVEWIGLSADLDPRPDGRFRFEVAPGQFCEGRYVALEPPHRLVFTWGWTDPAMDLPPGSSTVEARLTERRNGTTWLRLTHTGLPGGMRPLHEDGWTRFLARLTAALDGTPPPDYPTDDPAVRAAELAGDD
jgi:uncharacterized protein YndB with AHSA1/START domain